MIEPTLTTRDMLMGFYAAFVIFGGLYLLHGIPFLWKHYHTRDKRKRKGK